MSDQFDLIAGIIGLLIFLFVRFVHPADDRPSTLERREIEQLEKWYRA